ncbi:uracil-DNA glycosylase family protein [Tateyamaria armeniaca]|uniref:Uracil-DNA glycosylase family protein n=1 Tax=Tateyamaria armeniaca TaxID=2518930 RepID=A0ABW8USC1_9RHOB
MRDRKVQHLEARIEAAYQKTENRLGWRFLYSPACVLSGAKVAFVGLNPGGSEAPDDHAEFAMANGSAYRGESWTNQPEGRSRLQLQVLRLFEQLRVQPEDVLAGNLVPFRSPTWSELRDKRFSMQFGRELWSDVLERTSPSLIVCMGRQATTELSGVVRAENEVSMPVGWGNVKASRADYPSGTIVGLPHLSRFSIFGRRESESAIKALFDL